LDIKPNEKVLEIGTGSGYQCAVLIEMGAKVFSIERQEKLFNQTYKLMSSLHYLPKLFFGDGYKGCKTYAPFDKIIITAAPEALPEELLHQLVVGGIMVCPVGIEKEQDMLKITRISETEYKKEKLGKCAFVTMLQGVN
jgi:protein-L-isoaspartate(D-aspartate) O-methyltransferase